MEDRDDILEEVFAEYQQIIDSQDEIIVRLCKEKNALQAKIDQLMLEHHCRRKSGEQSSVAISDQECPEEMTQDQIENWEQHQVVSNHSESGTNFLETNISSDNLDRLAENSMESVMNSDPEDSTFSEVSCSHGREQKKTTPDFRKKMADGFMLGANFKEV